MEKSQPTSLVLREQLMDLTSDYISLMEYLDN